MLRFGMLGIGQGGTSIAEYAFTQGFKVIVANTAQVDLDQTKYISNDCKIFLGGRGAGREREVGIRSVVDNADILYQKCEAEFKDCDAVFVAATGGGGTGSGGLPVALDILMQIHKYVGAIIVLPDEMESPKAKMNTLECFSQISQFENLGSVFIIDNQKAKELNQKSSRRQIYELTNKEVIDFLVELNELTDRPSYVSNFDAGDLLSVIQERGYTLISKVEYYGNNSDNKFDIAKRIRESWSTSCQPLFNDGQIMKGAVIGLVDEAVSTKVDVGLIFQETSIPYDFNDVYFEPEPQQIDSKFQGHNLNVFYTILSGLAFPEGRLGKINEKLKSIEDKLMTNMNISLTQKFQTESWNNKFSKKVVNLDFNKSDKPQKVNLTERLAKYKQG
jgi:cell division GTPase FtsZ